MSVFIKFVLMKGDDIQFLGSYGNEAFVVRVSLYWNDTYYLFVNHYLVGTILKRNNQWIGSFHKDTDYTAADVFIIAEMIEAHEW